MRILLIEDSVDFRDIIPHFLEGLRAEILIVTDYGPDIRQEIISHLIDGVDLIVSDYFFSDHLSFEDVVDLAGDTPIILQTSDDDPHYHIQIPKRNLAKLLKPTIEAVLLANKKD